MFRLSELLRNIVNGTVCWQILWHFVCQLWHFVYFVTFRLLDGIKNAVSVQEKWAILDNRRYKTWFYYNSMQHTCAHVAKRSGALHQLMSWNWKREERRPTWRITIKSRDESDLCSKDPTNNNKRLEWWVSSEWVRESDLILLICPSSQSRQFNE